MTRRRYSICMNIEGFLRNNRYPQDFDVFQHDDGNYTGGGCPGYEITDEEMPA